MFVRFFLIFHHANKKNKIDIAGVARSHTRVLLLANKAYGHDQYSYGPNWYISNSNKC